jgi:hypothetical protein
MSSGKVLEAVMTELRQRLHDKISALHDPNIAVEPAWVAADETARTPSRHDGQRGEIAAARSS